MLNQVRNKQSTETRRKVNRVKIWTLSISGRCWI